MRRVNIKIGCHCDGTEKCAACGGTGEFKRGVPCRSCGGGGKCRCVVERAQQAFFETRIGKPVKIGILTQEVLANLQPRPPTE